MIKEADMADEGTVFEQVEHQIIDPTTDAAVAFAASRQRRLSMLAALDRRFAWIVTCLPAAGFVVAVALAVAGFAPTPTILAIWLGMHMAILVGVEVGFHRHFSHRSFKTFAPIRVGLAILGSMAFQGPVIWWAATHRRHHQFSDRPGDPHSPQLGEDGFIGSLQGLFHAHIGWLFVAASTRAPGWDRYVRDLYRDQAILRVHVNYFLWLFLGFLIPAVLGALLTWSWTGAALGFLWGGLARVFVMNHVIYWCINSVTHTFGTRPFHTRDLSTNNVWLAIPTLGQAWHNNHHAFPGSASMSMRWWELDPGAWVVRGLEKLGLAWDVRYPTREMIDSKRKARTPAPGAETASV
jgi:stearoyl-CoA desaturase (delta-9 desaturase)